MNLKITKVEKKVSRKGGYYYHISFKDKEGNDYYTYVYCKFRNYHRWKKVMKVGTVLSGLKRFNKTLINADSKFQKEKEL